MKKSILVCVYLICCAFAAYSQSAKELVSNYKSALGKSVDESSIKTLKLDATFVIKKISFPVVIYVKPPSLSRTEMTFQNMIFLQLTNDSLKWEFNPMLEDGNKVTRMEKNSGWNGESNTFDFINKDLINYKDLNHDLSVKGRQKMDSLEVYVLEMKKSNKTKAKFFLNTRNHLIYKIEDDHGYRYFSDYRIIDGYAFPMKIYESNQKENIDVHFSKITFNEPIADSLFLIPRDALDKRNEQKKTVSKYVSRGDSLYYKEQFKEAIAAYDQAIKLNAGDFLAYNGRGLAKIGLEQFYEALADFTKALEINPSSPVARNNLGLAKYYIGDHAGAIKDYSKALEIKSDYVVTLKNRGLLYMEDKKYDLAVQDLKAASKISPKEGFIYLKLGVSLAELERYEEAIDAYELAIANNYTIAEVYNYRGVSEYRLEKYDTASISFKKAVDLEPENLQYIENCGRALYESGAHMEASEHFEKYLAKKKDNPSVYNMNGLCKYRDENYKAAIKDFSVAIELNGKEAVFYDNRASAKEMLEDYEGAIKDYGESIRIYPNDASVFYKRGLVKIATSKKMEGCLDLATANEMKYEPAREAILKNCN